MAEEKRGAERRYGKKDAAPARDPEPAAEPDGDEDGGGAGGGAGDGDGDEGGGGPAPDDMGNRQATERQAMRKSHEGERRDLHGQHRTAHRQMGERQEKEMAEMMARHEAEMGGGEGGGAPDQQAAPAGNAQEAA